MPGAQTEYVLRSRHWLGRAASPPQALEVLGADGKNYVVEYREDADWDRGQGSPVVLISAVRGSTADLAHPQTNSATHLGMMRIPITFGAPGSVFNGPGFGVEVLDRSASDHTARLRLRPGRVNWTPLTLTAELGTLSEQVVDTGETTFERGDLFCAEGTWPYQKLERKEVATLEVGYALAVPPVSVLWTLDGQILSGAAGNITSPGKTVRLANPKLSHQTSTQAVVVDFQIEPLPAGSRLKLFNRPTDETYDVELAAVPTTAVGHGIERTPLTFRGIEYRYPQEFYDQREACIQNFVEIGERYVRYRVVLEPDLWRRVPERVVPQLQRALRVLGQLRELGDERGYELMVGEVARITGTATVTPTVLSRNEPARLKPRYAKREPKTVGSTLSTDTTVMPASDEPPHSDE